MGFFSKIFKGVKKVFKKIGKGIKSAFKKFGKFMGKIGILGQVAMMFILPGIGNAILGTAGTAATVAGVGGATVTAAAVPASGLLGGALGSVGVAAGKAAVWVGNKIAAAKNVFSNITSGVVDTLGNFAKTATNKLANSVGMDNVFQDAAKNFFGPDSAFSKSFGKDSRFASLTDDPSKFKAIDESQPEAFTDVDGKTVDFKELPSETAPSVSTGDLNFPQEQIGVEGGFTKVSSVTPPSANSLLSPEEMTKLGELPISDFESQGFSSIPKTGDLEFKFGDNTMFASPEKLKTMQGSEYFKQFATGNTQKSLLSRATSTVVQGIKGLPEKGIQEAKSFFDDPFDNLGEKVTQGVQTKALQGLGIQDKPMAPVYNQYASYVPQFETASQGAYGAPEIMNARSFEQQVTNNPNPYGYTAFQYDNYMSQTA
jgi:hypothetical protein